MLLAFDTSKPATNVELRVKLHKGFTFKNEEQKNLGEDGSLLLKHIGNAFNAQEVSIEYCMKSKEELNKMSDVDFTKTTKIPFQTQITYNTLDGMKCVRLITKNQDITFEREEAKKQANYKVISVNAVQQTAKLARAGNYSGAKANAIQWKNAMKGSEEYGNFVSSAAPLYDAISLQQDEELEEEEMPKAVKHRTAVDKVAKKERRQMDFMVSASNQAVKMNYKKMSKK